VRIDAGITRRGMDRVHWKLAERNARNFFRGGLYVSMSFFVGRMYEIEIN